ncbi:MAG TPA: T9SS type A sorting domain-containing protein [Bacteroidia bacterium]|nr:T9SS type A sorting domain-containing protein [Bacteroidia bacterium]
MRKLHYVLSVLLFIVIQNINAQMHFQKHFSDLIEYQKITSSPFDNSYIMACSKRDKDGLYDFCVVKLDNNGTVIWSKTYPSPDDDYLTALSVSAQGDIILGGYKLNEGDFDFSLMKLDASGKLQTYKTYGTIDLDIPSFIGTTSNGDFFICGNRNTDKAPILMRIDESGAVLWSKTYATSGSSNNLSVLASTITKDGGMALFGQNKSYNYFMKLTSDGSVAYSHYYPVTLLYENQCFMKQTSDDGFILVGKTPHCNDNFCTYNFTFTKFDQMGNEVWAQSIDYKYTSGGKDVVETSDGGFLFTGQLTDPVSLISSLLVIKTDKSGKFLFSKIYGISDSNGEYACIEKTSDDGFLFLGAEGSSAYLIKTNSADIEGCNEKKLTLNFVNLGISKSTSLTVTEIKDSLKAITSPVCTEITILLKDSLFCNSTTHVDILNTANYKIYPNPFYESLIVDMANDSSFDGGCLFTMYDVFGREVIQLPIPNHYLKINRENLPNGIYFYKLNNRNDSVIGSGKIIAN